MRHPALLDRGATVLVLIDLQEGYRRALHGWERVVAASRLLVEGAAVLADPLDRPVDEVPAEHARHHIHERVNGPRPAA